jgi:gluconolactonase
MTAGPNPIDGFVVDASSISYVGDSLQRPECILAERDGSLWARTREAASCKFDRLAPSD